MDDYRGAGEVSGKAYLASHHTPPLHRANTFILLEQNLTLPAQLQARTRNRTAPPNAVYRGAMRKHAIKSAVAKAKQRTLPATAFLKKNRRTILFAFAFSLPFALSFTIPYAQEEERILSYALLGLLFSIPLTFFFSFLLSKLGKTTEPCHESVESAYPKLHVNVFKRPGFYVLSAALLIIWGVVFYIVYPGIFTNDSNIILKMVYGLPFETPWFRYDMLNTHHPPFYVFLIWLVIQLGQSIGLAEAGVIALVPLAHMLFMAITCSWCTVKLFCITRSKTILVISLLFFLVNPLLAIYSVTVWKDVIFGCVLYMLLIRLLEFVGDPAYFASGITQKISFALILLACSLLRSNGIAVALVACVALIVFSKLKRLPTLKPTIVVSVSTLVAAVLVTSALYPALGLRSAHFSESISLPIQQVGRTIHDDGFITPWNMDTFDHILSLDDWESSYKPEIADPIKFNADFDDEYLESNKLAFIKAWVRTGFNNPELYFLAWADQTQAFWNIPSSTMYFGGSGYILEGTETQTFRNSIAYVADEEFVISAGYAFIDLCWPFTNAAFLAWLILFALLLSLYRRKYDSIVFLLPLIALWLTYLVAVPANDFRYIFPLYLALPLVVYTLLPDKTRIRLCSR